MSLRQDLNTAAWHARGSYKTRATHVAVAKRLCNYLERKNQGGLGLANLKTQHLTAYASDMLARGCSARTVQSEISALRVTLRSVKRYKLADAIDNKALGIAGASRRGTHSAIPEDQYRALMTTLSDHGHIGVAACVQLQRGLGLRQKEAISSTKSLKTWQRALTTGRPIRVVTGTKGGRPRVVHVHNVERAIEAVDNALAVAKTRRGWLIDKPSLESAMCHYTNALSRCGATGKYSGHSLRYAFTRDQVDGYIAAGLSRHEAFAAVSQDLGHGDGRGRYVAAVYLR